MVGSHLPELNRRPLRYECSALPAELKWLAKALSNIGSWNKIKKRQSIAAGRLKNLVLMFLKPVFVNRIWLLLFRQHFQLAENRNQRFAFLRQVIFNMQRLLRHCYFVEQALLFQFF